ncbi:MAG: hypothetical protein ABIS50_19010 [Luteolibacter sp.]|uniref:hypothetical protein n=1 Tax=Luteolibacter sp. TaxID=1962973 RepID=UPI00326586F3
MSATLRVLCLLTAAILPLSAQKAKPSEKSEKGLTVRLVADEVTEGQAKVLIQVDEKKSEPLDLPANRLSDPVPVTGRSLVLKTADGGTELCTVTLPEAGKSFAVLLASEKPAGYAPFVVRTDDPAFKAGDVFFINRTAKAMVMKLGGTDLVIEPGQFAKSRPTNPEDKAYHIVISERDETGEKLVSSTRWPAGENLRSYIFLTTDAKGKTTYRAVDEYLEAGKSKKKRR